MFTLNIYSTIVLSVLVAGMVIFDFTAPLDQDGWQVINDVVMGGRSRSEFVAADDSTAVFQGFLSLDNYGGFASIRSAVSEYDLGGYAGLELRVRGDGRRYHVRLRTTDSFDDAAYKYEFDTEKDRWIDVRAPFEEFVATYRGRILRDYPPLDPSAVRQIGFLLGDKKEGPFRLEIDRVGAYPKPE